MAYYAVTIQRPVTVFDGEINDAVVQAVIHLDAADRRITAIKLIRHALDLDLLGSKQVTEAILDRHGRR